MRLLKKSKENRHKIMIKWKRTSEESKVDIVGEKNQVKQKMQQRGGEEKERKP